MAPVFAPKPDHGSLPLANTGMRVLSWPSLGYALCPATFFTYSGVHFGHSAPTEIMPKPQPVLACLRTGLNPSLRVPLEWVCDIELVTQCDAFVLQTNQMKRCLPGAFGLSKRMTSSESSLGGSHYWSKILILPSPEQPFTCLSLLRL